MLAHEGQRSASAAAAEGTVTADMVAQLAYCPRRFHLAYVEGRWADNVETDGGRFTHRRVDAVDQPLPAPDQVTAERRTLRSVSLHDEARAISAKLDAVEIWRDEATGEAVAFPVETKRGNAPCTEEGTWEPERVQLMVQGLVLRASGYAATAGAVYYAESSRRVEVALDDPLLTRTLTLVEAARDGLKARDLPAPLADSPKCPRCSLVGICLPDETRASSPEAPATAAGEAAPEVRRLFPARDDATPLYVQEQGAFVGKYGEVLTVSREGERLAEARLKDVSQLVLCGSVGVGAAALHLLCESGKPIVHLTRGHWFCGITQGHGLKNGYDRAAQFRVAGEPERCLVLAREFVKAKGANQRTLLRRNAAPAPDQGLSAMAQLIDRVDEVIALDELLGIEGSIAARYFGSFGTMLRPKDQTAGGAAGGWDFDFGSRNRRPPRDPVNAMLSFGYALLAKECTVALAAVGLDPFWGFYHQPRHGRPALALDLMEEFRPLVVDSAVITALNTGMVTFSDFVRAGNACSLSGSGRKAFIRAYEGRLDQLATHPAFDYRCSWRRLIGLQAQLLARHLRGDVAEYRGITTR
jgi:CRISPR-associated protein Cas1